MRRRGDAQAFEPVEVESAARARNGHAGLDNGRIEQQGAPMELYERPLNRFVAGFLGQPKMNFLPGSAVAVHHPGLSAGAIEVGIRPNMLKLVGEGEFRLPSCWSSGLVDQACCMSGWRARQIW